jgi:phosphoadenosine phosphosulfate reductase
MYKVQWDTDTGGLLLTDPTDDGINSEVRPVFHEELSLLGFDKVWQYPECEQPLLWAVGRRYFHKGQIAAEAKGGGFFEAPQLVVQKKDLRLKPVDVPTMIKKNSPFLRDLAHEAIEFIRETQDRERHTVDIAAVAFSGGKDSLVVLDLVQRALRPDEFVVVFNDTDMEITPTLEAVEAAKHRWSNLRFYTSKSHKSAQQSWKEFGPPSRIHRWCCAVHKSVPNLLLLRKITSNPQARALVYDGIRADESAARSGYRRIVPGGKHECQTNASPILNWTAAEVFLYLLQRRIMLNSGYRYGFARVGCSVCPVASNWWEALSWLHFSKDCEPLLNVLIEYSKNRSERNDHEKGDFIKSGAWKARAGGRSIIGYSKVTENNNGDTLKFAIREPLENWLEWAKVLGGISKTGPRLRKQIVSK